MSYMQMNKEAWLSHADELHADDKEAWLLHAEQEAGLVLSAGSVMKSSSYRKHPVVTKPW